MRSIRVQSMVVLFLAVLASDAVAQRRITGRVTATVSGEPLPGATVSVIGTAFGSHTDDQGRFTVNAPDGDVSLRLRRLGYKGVTLAVASGQNEVSAQLERDVLQLEELIVTGQATSVSRRNAANDVAVVTSEDLTRAPTPTIENALQGKIPGATIQANSGAPGGGMQVQLRGVTTINAAADPIYVVDGVIVSNDAIQSGLDAVTLASGGSSGRAIQDNPVNRIADINPADIERIEVLKGASASAIYGSKAANGVIIITTKTGATGKARFNLLQRFGTFDLSNTINNRHWTLEDALDNFAGSASDTTAIRGMFQNGGFQDHQQQLFGEHDLSFETNLSVRGGTDETKYYVSGLVKRDAGIMQGTGYEKQSARVNLTQLLGSRLTANVSTNLVHSRAKRGIGNNDNAVVAHHLVLALTPSFVDLRPQNGVYPPNFIVSTNPFQTRDLMRNDEDVYRAVGAGTLRYDLLTTERQSLALQLTGGIDQFTQRNELLFPPELFFEPEDGTPGTAILGNNSNVNTNVNFSVTHNYFPASRLFSATTSGGIQRGRRNLKLSGIVTKDLLAAQGNIDRGAQTKVSERRELEKDFALFGQEEVLMFDERLLLTAGVRAERSSSNGDKDKFYLFPKGAVSYRLPAFGGFLNSLKVRAAVGQSGNKPLYGMKFTSFSAGNYGGALSLAGGTLPIKGNPDIRPERQTEIEGGFDATLFNEVSTLSFTVYQKSIADLILQREVAPSTGFNTQLFNGAKLRNRGVEIGLTLNPIETSTTGLLSRVTFAKNVSKITQLPVPAFEIRVFGTDLGQYKIEQGQSATQIIGRFRGETVKLGDAAPDFQMSFANDLRWRQWRLSGLFDWKKGSQIINLTKFLYDLIGNNVDFEAGARRVDVFSDSTAAFIEDGGYVKLREVSLSYQLPSAMVSRFFSGRTRAARMELSGRNLVTWSDYSGLDPEVSNFGNQAISRNVDVTPYPPSRSIFFTIDVEF